MELHTYTPVVTVVATALVPFVLWILWSAARGGEELPTRDPSAGEVPYRQIAMSLSELDEIVRAPDPAVESAIGDLDAAMAEEERLEAELAALDAELGYGPSGATASAKASERAGPRRAPPRLRDRLSAWLGL